uniref:Uncharacterized protein n=1 Tax=Anopheles farauti TaxID=69004 RepID=A0A182Q279_9DIPT
MAMAASHVKNSHSEADSDSSSSSRISLARFELPIFAGDPNGHLFEIRKLCTSEATVGTNEGDERNGTWHQTMEQLPGRNPQPAMGGQRSFGERTTAKRTETAKSPRRPTLAGRCNDP